MLEEHKAIRAAVENLRVAARADNAERYERLANDLALHAQTEEELLYCRLESLQAFGGGRRRPGAGDGLPPSAPS
jgi:hypothetical protein